MLIHTADHLGYYRAVSLLVALLRRLLRHAQNGIMQVYCRDGFQQIIHRAGAQRMTDIFKLLITAQHDKPACAFLTNGVDHLQPAHARHDHIGDHNIRLHATDTFNPLHAIGRRPDHFAVESVPLQKPSCMLKNQRLVIHQQNPVHDLPSFLPDFAASAGPESKYTDSSSSLLGFGPAQPPLPHR